MSPKKTITNTKASLLMLATAQALVNHNQTQVSNQMENVGFGDHRYNIQLTVTVTKIEE